MKIIAVIFSAFILIFVSCASNQGGGAARGGGSGAASGGSGSPGEIPVETKSEVLFADGSLDEYVTSDYDSSFESLLNQNRYSASGALVEQVEYAYQEERGWLTTKITRDVENRLKNRVVYQYNDQGLLWRETLVNKSGKAVSSYEYGYDAKGNRTSRIVNSGTGNRMAETLYTFNNNGVITASETKDGAGRRISSSENQYDGNGNLTSQKVFNADGQLTSVINVVWQDGHEVKNEQAGADGSVQLRVTNEYGSGGELLKKTVENFQGDSTQILQYEYTFKPGRRQI
jgi:hypothetical protein